MNCIALAPVPITATLRPARSIDWSHRAEWKAGPSKEPKPGMVVGRLGRLSWPTALTTASNTSASSRPSPVRTVTVQRRSSSDQTADTTSVPNRIRSRSPNASAQPPRYCWSTGCVE